MEKIFYREEQRFSQLWLWLILLPAFGIPILVSLNQMINNAELKENELLMHGFILVFILVLGVILSTLILKMKLVIEIKQFELRFRYPPLVTKWKNIGKNEIEHFEVRRYKPIAEFGGWGIKTSWKRRNIAYNVKGNIGLQLYLKNGKKILLGTQRKQAIEHAMEKLINIQE